MTWYAFFVTINYASMGWLAKSPGGGSVNRNFLFLIASVFITQNIIGMVVIFQTAREVREMSGRVSSYESLPFDKENEAHAKIVGSDSAPARLYWLVACLMATAMVPIILAWAAFPFLS